MSIPIIDQLKPLGNFPAVEASDVQVGNERLSTVLSNTPSTAYVDSVAENKVDKEQGKGLSANDYTAAEKNKLAGIEPQANKTIVDSVLSSSSTNPAQNKIINAALEAKADIGLVDDVLWRIGNSSKIASERLFRDIVHHENGVQSRPCQCVVYAEETFVVGGRIQGNEKQKITVYSPSGAVVKEQEYTDTDLYHFNGIAYNPESEELYTTGVNNKIVVIDYTTLTIKRKLTIDVNAYAISFSGGKLYILSSNARGLRAISEVNTTTGELTEVCSFDLKTEERIIQFVVQDMVVINDVAYICCNQDNAIIAIKLDTGELYQSYAFDIGDGMFPYGELESATEVHGQLYFLSVVWNRTHESWILQIFKSNIGGSVIPCALIGQNALKGLNIVIDSNSNFNNPVGSSTFPFKTLVEASAYASYHSQDLNTSIVVTIVANSQFESDDALSLYSASAEINMNTVRVPHTYLRDGVFSVFNADSDFEIRNSVIKIYASTIRSLTQYYGILAIGVLTNYLSDTVISLDGVTIMPYKLSDVNVMTLHNCEIITNSNPEIFGFTPEIAWQSGETIEFESLGCSVSVKNGIAHLFMKVRVSNWGTPTNTDFIEIGGFDTFPFYFDKSQQAVSYGNIYLNDGAPSKYVLRIQNDKKSLLVTSSSGNWVSISDLSNGAFVITADIPVTFVSA